MIKNLFAFTLILTTIPSFAQGPIITPNDFAAEMKTNKSLVVIDVNAADVYAKQHITGAVNLFHKELYKSGTIEGQSKSSGELAVIFGNKGISNASKIVIYDEGSNRYNSRVWWILKSVGAADVSILHFNKELFAAAQIPLTTTPSTMKATTFTVNESPYTACTMAEIQKLPEGTLLLDNREKDEFEGTDAAKRSKGHIPGAVWMNYKEVLTTTGAFKPKNEIIAVAAKYGATPDKRIVVYCNSGVRASVLYIALKEIAGFQNVRYYAGSYVEWASIPGNRIIK